MILQFQVSHVYGGCCEPQDPPDPSGVNWNPGQVMKLVLGHRTTIEAKGFLFIEATIHSLSIVTHSKHFKTICLMSFDGRISLNS